MRPSTPPQRFGSGQTVRRIEDLLLVAGRGQYADDVTRPEQTHLVFLRSPYAHARIAGVDTRRGAGRPGVIAVLTGADLKGPLWRQADARQYRLRRPDGSPFATAERHVLATDAIALRRGGGRRRRHEPRAAAQGAEAIIVDYEELTPVVDRCGDGAGARAVPCGAGQHRARRATATLTAADAFARAAHVVGADRQPAPGADAVEPRAVLAEIDADSGRLRRAPEQPDAPTAVLGGMCAAIPAWRRRCCVVVGDVGGGFGMKGGIYPEDIVVVCAAWTLKRPASGGGVGWRFPPRRNRARFQAAANWRSSPTAGSRGCA